MAAKHAKSLNQATETDTAQAIRIKRFLIASATYVLAIAIVAVGTFLEIWDTTVLITYSALVIAANAIFYGIFRSGLNQKTSDPSLTVAQIATGIAALMYIAYHAGPARGIIMLWVLMIFMFAVFRLKAQQMWLLAVATWLAYSVVIGLIFQLHGHEINAGLEVFQWLVLGAALAWFTFMGGYVSNMRSKLRRNEVFYRSMWETAHDAIIIVGPGGVVEYANPAVQAIFGHAPDALTGKPLTQHLAHYAPSSMAASFKRYLEEGQTTQDWDAVELLFTHNDGHEFPAEVSVDEMMVENRRACLLFIRNIAVRKQTEQALVTARVAAEAASRTKSQFLANMTHEIRTPMNGIIGMAEILQHEPLDTAARGYVDTIHRSGLALLGVVNDVLDFSKIEAGTLDMERKVFDLPHVLREVHDLYAESARAKNIALQWEVPPALPVSVFGDPMRLRQMLCNLVANAVKFTDRGAIELRVMLESTDQIRFEVRDTGIGISFEKQRLIFDAFAQVDGSTTRRFGGTGLGLTITRQIVHLMGGEIGLSSDLGKGSRFWFSIPLPRAVLPGAKPVLTVVPVVARFTGKKILLVEDDESNAEIAMVLLGRFGPDVRHVVNGALAVAAYRESTFDMVFMDCQMPVMDGLEATRQIRAIERSDGQGHHTPICALTAHSFAGYREECLAAGMDDFMTKPVSTDDFLVMLNRWLSGTPPIKKTA